MKLLMDAIQSLPSTEWWLPLVNGGSAGAVLGAAVIWFAFRLEKILDKMREGMERNTKALMISVLNTRNLDDGLKALAEQIQQEATDALKK